MMFEGVAAAQDRSSPFPSTGTKTCSRCKQEKPVTEFHIRSDRPSGRQSQCKSCACALRAIWRSKNSHLPERREDARLRTTKWREANPERWRANNKAWAAANPNHSAEAGQRYRARNPDARQERLKNNPGFECAYSAARRARKNNATPLWADKEAIAAFYRLAKEKTDATGTAWHVDHIIPLKHKLVCGLHVPQNLQVLPGPENIRKSNRFTP